MTSHRTSLHFTAWITGLALLLGTAPGLRAQDWSQVPADQFVAQAVAAVTQLAEQSPDTLASELAAILNAAAAIQVLTNDDLLRIATAAYAGQNVDPLILVRSTYPLIKPEHRSRIANILLSAAPANARTAITAAITTMNLPPVPPAVGTMRDTSLPTVSKE